MDIIKCDKDDYRALAAIWERSVRASHDFLTEDSILEIRSALIPVYFPAVDIYAVGDRISFAGFIGLRGDCIEMLFIDSDRRGLGYGSALIDFAKACGARRVDVNEQNESALKFYERKGFMVRGRDELDEAGRPYPILHLSL